MTDQPTIWDILGYEESGGQQDMISYLADTFLSTQGDNPFEGIGGMSEDYFKMAISAMGSDENIGLPGGGTGKDFSELSEDEIQSWLEMGGFKHSLSGYDVVESGEFTGEWVDEESRIEKLMPMFQAMQEGFKAVPTSESFGLGRKIGDIETTGKRELKSAREGYIPGEIISRYGALQGKAGAQQKGEQLEQAYTEDIYGVQRGMGRDIQSTYGDFEDEWFGGVESWLSNLG